MKFRIFALLSVFVIATGVANWIGCSAKSEATTVEVKLPTLQCAVCVNTVETAVKQVDGVQSVSVDLNAKTAKVTFDAELTSVPALEKAIVQSGYAANDTKADSTAYQQLPSCCKVPDAAQ